QVTDGFGNPVPGVTVTFSAPGAGPTGNFSGSPQATVTTDADGLATAPTISAGDVAGSYQVLATADGVATPAAFEATDTAGAPVGIAAVSGGGQSAKVGSPYAEPFVAQVTDQFGNPVPGVTVTFSAPGADPTGNFSGRPQASVTTDADGLATAPTFSAGDVVGTYEVVASTEGVVILATFGATDTAGTPAAIAVVSGDGQSATVGTAFADLFVAEVTDEFGNPVPGVVVTFRAPGTNPTGTFSGSSQASVTTDAAGLATTPTFMAGELAGSYQVLATAAGVATPAAFDATDAAGAPADVAIVSGDGQSGVREYTFASPLTVVVRDRFGNPVPGVAVTFNAPAHKATAKFDGEHTALVPTNAAGLAISPTVTAGTVIGSYNVSASVSPTVTPGEFTLSNVAGSDLRVSEKAQSGPAPGTASIVLTARNGGPNGDTNVVITDVVTTPGLKLLKPNSNVCTVAGNTVTCHRPTFGRQGVFVIVIAVTGISGDPVSAHGSITGALPDPVLSNNQVTASTTIL
ncbi:MAG TPA: Ig-like domain-containing protein, partial [Acidimicrobiales bacterium]|nr:Ig-like domain-containing protein [Acidimicrobiales bacterium]